MWRWNPIQPQHGGPRAVRTAVPPVWGVHRVRSGGRRSLRRTRRSAGGPNGLRYLPVASKTIPVELRVAAGVTDASQPHHAARSRRGQHATSRRPAVGGHGHACRTRVRAGWRDLSLRAKPAGRRERSRDHARLMPDVPAPDQKGVAVGICCDADPDRVVAGLENPRWGHPAAPAAAACRPDDQAVAARGDRDLRVVRLHARSRPT
jgi:hypothetical protein